MRRFARFIIGASLISVVCVFADLCGFARNLPSIAEKAGGEVSRRDAEIRKAAKQTDAKQSGIVRLFKLEGTFGEDLPVKRESEPKSTNPGFNLTGARLEADRFGFGTRLRSILTIGNGEDQPRITEVEWRLDLHDSSLGNRAVRVVQSEKINIYPGETGMVSQKFGAVLPDRMVVLLQLSRVSFADGSAWLAEEECELREDLRTVSCKSR